MLLCPLAPQKKVWADAIPEKANHHASVISSTSSPWRIWCTTLSIIRSYLHSSTSKSGLMRTLQLSNQSSHYTANFAKITAKFSLGPIRMTMKEDMTVLSTRILGGTSFSMAIFPVWVGKLKPRSG